MVDILALAITAFVAAELTWIFCGVYTDTKKEREERETKIKGRLEALELKLQVASCNNEASEAEGNESKHVREIFEKEAFRGSEELRRNFYWREYRDLLRVGRDQYLSDRCF